MIGWIAVAIGVSLSCFWAWWGILENFHEGWYLQTFSRNLLLTAAYLAPALMSTGIVMLSIGYPKIGSTVIMVLGLALIAWWLYERWPPSGTFALHVVTVSGLLLIGLGVLFRIGSPEPKKMAYLLCIGLPLAVILLFGFQPARRVMQRVDDNIRDARVVQGNQVELLWAPEGPGWPKRGKKWEKAVEICQYLNADGKTLNPQKQNIWRLPTVQETVGSMTRLGKNAGGRWDDTTFKATYRIGPDKESPLWNSRSQIIYWWTATPKTTDSVFVVCFNGKVFPRSKKLSMGSLAFRAVRDIPPP